MFNSFCNNQKHNKFYTQEQLFTKIVLNCFKNYPELAFLVNDTTAATNEGVSSNNDSNSWSCLLANEGLLEKSPQKHVELERTLQSLVCFNLIMDGSESAYNYWIQKQQGSVLSNDSFSLLHNLAKNCQSKIENFTDIIEASLVYSDLGKSKIIKDLGIKEGINIDDHDDFMEALYASKGTIREKIIPSFSRFPENIQKTIIQLNTAVPIHWGYFLQLEGGQDMFTKLLVKNHQISIEFFNLNFLINICDIAGALAHVSPLGSLTFNQQVFCAFQMVAETIEQFLKDKDPKKSYLDLMRKKANYLGYSLDTEQEEKFSILTRIGFFLRMYTSEQGELLKTYASEYWSSDEWSLVKKSFGVETGINSWEHHPTYIPAVLLNLFNSASETQIKYQRALAGLVILAKIIDEYERLGYNNLASPLCFNKLAAQAKSSLELFTGTFEVSQINWDDPKNLIINPPEVSSLRFRLSS